MKIIYQILSKYLELGLSTSLLHDSLKRSSLHDISLDLELARHEELLGVSLSVSKLSKVVVREDEGDVSLSLLALGDGTGSLKVQSPGLGLAFLVLEGKYNDSVGLLDDLLFEVLVLESEANELDELGGGEGGIDNGRHYLIVRVVCWLDDL